MADEKPLTRSERLALIALKRFKEKELTREERLALIALKRFKEKMKEKDNLQKEEPLKINGTFDDVLKASIPDPKEDKKD